jgi:hypothetical protein
LKDIQGDPGLQRTELENDRGPYVGSPGRPRIRRFAHDPALDELFLELHLEFGPQHWWPAATPFEVIVGAILTQNTAWRNVELALAAEAVAEEGQTTQSQQCEGGGLGCRHDITSLGADQ